jgi:catechol 2,3-dioxygenase-like lactoylglutathione lyase family enzyme
MNDTACCRFISRTSSPVIGWEADTMEYKLELVVIPVTDIDRAKDFYANKAGFHVDVDHRAGEDFRVVQLTPPGSACSLTLMRNPESAGRVQGLHLVVPDIDAARADLTGRGIEVSEPFHFGPAGQTPGYHPARESYGTYLAFSDPDGNGFLVQEVRRAGSPE